MALYLVEQTSAQTRVNGVKAMILEADSAAEARELAAAKKHGDSAWSGATVTEIAAGVASDYEDFHYHLRVSDDDPGEPLFDIEYTGVASDTVDLIGAAFVEELRGSAVAAAIADDGAVYTDETTEANEGTGDDMNLLPATPAENDAYIFGMALPFTRLLLNVTTAGVGTYTVTWQYWDGDSWEDLTGVTDDTTSFKTAGLNDVVWTLPGDWAASTINSQGPFYYVRAIVDDGTCTTTPLGGQAYTGAGTRAAYDTGTNVLTIAAIADGIGDHNISLEATPNGCTEPVASLIGTVVDGGIAAAVLTAVLEAPTAIPAILREL